MKRENLGSVPYHTRKLMEPHVEGFLLAEQAFRIAPDARLDPYTWEWYRLVPDPDEQARLKQMRGGLPAPPSKEPPTGASAGPVPAQDGAGGTTGQETAQVQPPVPSRVENPQPLREDEDTKGKGSTPTKVRTEIE